MCGRRLKWLYITPPVVVLAVIILRLTNSTDNWETRTRKESLRIIRSIQSTNELRNVVGNGGVVLTLRDGSWIVIRDVLEFEPSREVAIAHDSGGGWFEGTRKFSGGLTWYPQYKMPFSSNETRKTTIECFLLEKVEGSKDLQEAREQLKALLGFIPLNER